MKLDGRNIFTLTLKKQNFFTIIQLRSASYDSIPNLCAKLIKKLNYRKKKTHIQTQIMFIPSYFHNRSINFNLVVIVIIVVI